MLTVNLSRATIDECMKHSQLFREDIIDMILKSTTLRDSAIRKVEDILFRNKDNKIAAIKELREYSRENSEVLDAAFPNCGFNNVPMLLADCKAFVDKRL